MKRLVTAPFRLLWALLVLSVPLLGFWLASSLAVFFNGPLWLALVAGLLFFAVLPLAWDAYANVKQRKKEPPPKRWFSHRTRILLRVLAVNLLLIAGLLAFYPRGAFEALSTRGDWMIEKKQGPLYDRSREALFFAADRLEWLYLAAREPTPIERTEEKDVVPIPPPPVPPPPPVLVEPPVAVVELPVTKVEPPVAAVEPPPTRWPLEKNLHPLIASIPPQAEVSHQSVAKYIAEQERDPHLRIKAIHDYIADRISYDVATMKESDPARRAKQDPETVWKTRTAVCDGYSQLFQAMVREIGGQAEYIGGESRDIDGSVSGVAHAWNAVVIEDVWYLVDVTWDAGVVKGDQYMKQYSTDYLLTPPDLFVITHFPSHEKWQLQEHPITRGEFMRKPMLRPSFYAEGLQLISPERSQVTVEGRSFEVLLQNRGAFYLIGTVRSKPSAEEQECVVRYEKSQAKITCELPGPGEYVVRMYGSKIAHGSYPMIGMFDVNAKG